MANMFAGLSAALEEYNETSETSRLLSVKIDDVTSTKQVRTNIRYIHELAQSIQEVGLQQPIVVKPKDAATGKYVIIQGERRWRACREAGLSVIDVIVKDELLDKEKLILAQLTENIQRDDMDPLEIAQAMHEMLEANPELTAPQISARLGKNRNYATTLLKLLELPKEVLEAKKKFDIRDQVTLTRLGSLFSKDAKAAKKLLSKTIAELDKKGEKDFSRSIASELNRRLTAGEPQQADTKPSADKDSEEVTQTPIPENSAHALVLYEVTYKGLAENEFAVLRPDVMPEEAGKACVTVVKDGKKRNELVSLASIRLLNVIEA